MIRFLLVALVGLSLTACTETLPKVQVSVPPVPAEMRQCADAPRAPKGTITQRDVAAFTVKLGASWKDCKNKLGQVDGLLKEYENARP